jgi:hypothetical protein
MFQFISTSWRFGKAKQLIQEDIIESCSGFYGDNFKENGMMEYIDQDLLTV